MHEIVNFYKFVEIEDPQEYRAYQQGLGERFRLKGTVLVAKEGMNAAISGEAADLDAYVSEIRKDERFCDLEVVRSTGASQPFTRFKTKLKDFIVVFDPNHEVKLGEINSVPHMDPEDWKEYLGKNSDDVVVLDTRNYYEVDYGTFDGAEHLGIRNFRQFPEKFLSKYKDQKDKTFLMFCTGGIRCEKAAVFAKKEGFENVHQLDGGILNYFRKNGQNGYKGSCFVFDHRWAVSADLEQSLDGPHPDQLDRVPELMDP